MEDFSKQLRRKEWLDALRAIAMLLVIFGHQVQWWDSFFTYTSAIKVPLFFAISGYLFKLRNNNLRVFFVNLFKKIIIPYICLALISAIITLPISGFDNFKHSVYKIFSGESYWFIPCLIIGESIFFFLANNLRSKWTLLFGCCASFVLGYVFKQHDILSFGMVNIAFEIQIFLLLGFLIRKKEDYLSRFKFISLFIMVFLYIILCYLGSILFEDPVLDIHLSKYYNLPYCFLLIVLGNLVLFTIGVKLVRAPRILTYIGQNTLVLYLWAGWGVLFPKLIIKLFELHVSEQSILFATTKLVSAVIFCSICSYFLNQYLPFLVGKSNNK